MPALGSKAVSSPLGWRKVMAERHERFPQDSDEFQPLKNVSARVLHLGQWQATTQGITISKSDCIDVSVAYSLLIGGVLKESFSLRRNHHPLFEWLYTYEPIFSPQVKLDQEP